MAKVLKTSIIILKVTNLEAKILINWKQCSNECTDLSVSVK